MHAHRVYIANHQRLRKNKMGKRINWEYANVRDKVAGNPFDNSYDWRQLKSLRDTTCEACTRRIKKGQMMMWNVNTKTVMHIDKECKLW